MKKLRKAKAINGSETAIWFRSWRSSRISSSPKASTNRRNFSCCLEPPNTSSKQRLSTNTAMALRTLSWLRGPTSAKPLPGSPATNGSQPTNRWTVRQKGPSFCRSTYCRRWYTRTEGWLVALQTLVQCLEMTSELRTIATLPQIGPIFPTITTSKAPTNTKVARRLTGHSRERPTIRILG